MISYCQIQLFPSLWFEMSVKFSHFFKIIKWLMVLTSKLTLCQRNLHQKLSFEKLFEKCFGLFWFSKRSSYLGTKNYR